MRKTIVLLACIAAVALAACTPVTIQKCIKEYEYGKDGKLVQEYSECISQQPEKVMPIHIKHKELYE